MFNYYYLFIIIIIIIGDKVDKLFPLFKNLNLELS